MNARLPSNTSHDPFPRYRLYLPKECTGKDNYPPIWHERLKHEVREQAGNRCVRCGHPYAKGAGEWSPCDTSCRHVAPDAGPVRIVGPDGPQVVGEDGESYEAGFVRASFKDAIGVEAQWRILTVHHLDGNKGNCRWWNLTALCQRCHLQIQGKVVMDRRWPHEHSDWFRPYVAGYYAHVYLGEDVTREEAEDRMDELLALESRQLELGDVA